MYHSRQAWCVIWNWNMKEKSKIAVKQWSQLWMMRTEFFFFFFLFYIMQFQNYVYCHLSLLLKYTSKPLFKTLCSGQQLHFLHSCYIFFVIYLFIIYVSYSSSHRLRVHSNNLISLPSLFLIIFFYLPTDSVGDLILDILTSEYVVSFGVEAVSAQQWK